MRPTLGRPCCPGESERSDLSGVEAKRPPLVYKYPENSHLFSRLVANCLCLLFVPKSELKLKFSVARLAGQAGHLKLCCRLWENWFTLVTRPRRGTLLDTRIRCWISPILYSCQKLGPKQHVLCVDYRRVKL